MAIEIQQEQQGNVRILALSGRLDTETAADVELALQDLLNAGECHFLIDMRGIGYVSSAGLRVLLALAKQLDGGKGTLRICSLSPAVRQVFDVAGFSKLFSLFTDRAAALGEAPKARVEAVLAQRAAVLLGITAAAGAPHPRAAELARFAARLLGLKPVGKSSAVSQRIVAVARNLMTPAPVRRDTPAPGLLGKLRGLFGGKK
jgi:anti-anti-sigma factor